MTCIHCERTAHSGRLCRRHWDAQHGHVTSVTSYTPRAGRVRYHGLSLLPGTVAALERAVDITGKRTRAVIAAILDAWAAGKVWRLPRAAVGALALALLGAGLGWDCAARPSPMRVEIEPPSVEAFVATNEDALPRRVIPQEPADWQKKPPCDLDMDEHAIRGACYGRASKKPPCGKLIEYEGACYRAVAKAKEVPVSVDPDRPE